MQHQLPLRAKVIAHALSIKPLVLIALGLLAGNFHFAAYGQQSSGELSSQQGYNLEQAKLYNEEAKKLYREGHHQEAIPFAQKAIEFNQAALGTDSPTTAQLIDNLAKNIT